MPWQLAVSLIALGVAAADCSLRQYVLVPVDATDAPGDAVAADSDASDVASDVDVVCTICGGDCTDVTTDPNNCGACGMVCPAVAGGVAACIASVCGATCNPGSALAPDGTCVALTPPRLIAPLSMTIVASRTPSARISLPAGITQASIDVCADPGCAMPASFSPVVATGNDVPLPTMAAGTYFWRARSVIGTSMGIASPVWEFVVPNAPVTGPSAASHGALLDLDRDGTPELAVGSAHATSVFVDAFAAGSFTAMPTHPTGNPTVLRIASAGDLNGDGFGDMGATITPSGVPAVQIWNGGATGAVAATVLSTLPPGATQFGQALASAGDVNGDGYGDLAVTFLTATSVEVGVFYGSATGVHGAPDVVLVPHGDNAAGALAIGGAGDLDGDGFDDIVVGAPGSSVTGTGATGGVITGFMGSAGGINPTPSFSIAPAGAMNAYGAGASVAIDGDANADGYCDLIVGAPSAPSGGQAFVALGSATMSTGSLALIVSPALSAAFGTAVAFAHHFSAGATGDEIVIGAPALNSSNGTVYLYDYPLSPGGPTAVWPPPMPPGSASNFGAVLAGIGDVDHDGLDDVLVGAPGAGSAAAYLVTSMPMQFRALPTPSGSMAVGFGTSVAWFALRPAHWRTL